MRTTMFGVWVVFGSFAIADVALAGPGGTPTVGGSYKGTRFDGRTLTESFVQSLADSEGDPLLGWSKCSPGPLAQADCVVLTVGDVASHRELILSAEECNGNGTACYAGYRIEHAVEVELSYLDGVAEWREEWRMNVGLPMMSGVTRYDLWTYTEVVATAGASGSHWLTFYDFDGNYLWSTGNVADAGDEGTCDTVANVTAEIAGFVVQELFEAEEKIQAAYCDIFGSLDTIEAEVDIKGTGVSGGIDFTRSLDRCDGELAEIVAERDERVPQVKAAVVAAVQDACDGCPDGTVHQDFFVENTDGTYECYDVEYTCDGTADANTGLCNCDMVGYEEC